MLPRILAPLLADQAVGEIVVVVDGSPDNSEELLHRIAAEHPRLRPIVTENQGAAVALATGVEAADGEVVVILDDDVEACPGLVTGHAHRHALGDADLVVGYMPLAEESRRSGGVTARLYEASYEEHVRRWQASPPELLRSLWAGNLSIRRDAYLALEARRKGRAYGFHADNALGLCAEAAGLTAVFDKRLVARHLYTRTVEGFIRDARDQGTDQLRLARQYPHVDRSRALRLDNLPAPARAAVRFSRRPRGYLLLRSALIPLVEATSDSPLPVADLPALLLQRIEREQGIIAALREEVGPAG